MPLSPSLNNRTDPWWFSMDLAHVVAKMWSVHTQGTVLEASAMRCMASAMRWRLSCNMMSKHVKSRCLENCCLRCLECERKRTVARKSGDKSSSTTNQSRQRWCVVESVSCVILCNLMCVEPRPKERLTVARRADFDVYVGDDMMVTIMSRTVTCVPLSGLREGLSQSAEKIDCANESGDTRTSRS